MDDMARDRGCGLRTWGRALVLGFGLALGATAASAQTPSPGERRVIIGASLGVQFVKDAFQNTVDYELFQEASEFGASYNVTTDTAADAGASFRLWERFGVGVEVSHFYKRTSAVIEAEVPHPFFFGFPRTITGVAGGVTRRELALHMQAQYWHLFKNAVLVRGFFGPTYFDVSHDLVSEIDTAEVGFPFEEVTLVGFGTEKLSKSALGFNIGFDVSYFGLRRLGFLGRSGVLDHVAMAFTLRYSRGTSSVKLNGGFQPSFELGGTHLGIGVRVAF